MSLSEVIISFPICPHRCKPWLYIQNGVSDVFKQVLFKCLTFTSSGIILQRVTVAFTQAWVLCTFKALLQLADLLYPPAFSSRPPGIPAAHFRFASCQLIEAAVFLASYFLAFEFLPPGPGHPNFATCLRTSNDPWFTETSPIWLLFLLSAVTKSQTRHASGVNSAAFGSSSRCSWPFPTYLIWSTCSRRWCHGNGEDFFKMEMIWIVEQEHFRRFQTGSPHRCGNGSQSVAFAWQECAAVSGMSVCISHIHTLIQGNACTCPAAEHRNADSFADPESDSFTFCSLWSQLCLNRVAVLNYWCWH